MVVAVFNVPGLPGLPYYMVICVIMLVFFIFLSILGYLFWIFVDFQGRCCSAKQKCWNGGGSLQYESGTISIRDAG